MKSIKLVIFVFAMLIGTSSFAQTAAEVSEKFNEAATAFNEKKFDQAIALFKEVIKMGSTSEENVAEMVSQSKKILLTSYMNKGRMDAQAKKFDAALEEFKAASELAKAIPDIMAEQQADNMVSAVYSVQGTEKFKANDFAGAADVFNKAYTANNKDTKNGLLAAQAYFKAGNTAKSLEIYDSLIKLGETTPKFANAGKEAVAAVVADQTNSMINALKAKKYDEALAAAETALKYDPKAQAILMGRLQVLSEAKRYAEVAKVGPETISELAGEPAKSDAAFFVAIACQELKNLPEAIKYYKQVVAGNNAATAKKMAEDLAKAAAAQ